jgi:hypothetical protein
MSAKEVVITVLGLVGTFCMPWPGEPSRALHAVELARLHAAACVGSCRGSAAHAQRVREERRTAGE